MRSRTVRSRQNYQRVFGICECSSSYPPTPFVSFNSPMCVSYLFTSSIISSSSSPDLVLNAVQIHSIERRVGASASFCTDRSRLGGRSLSPGNRLGIPASGTPPVIVAFGSPLLASSLLQSAKLARVEVGSNALSYWNTLLCKNVFFCTVICR
jgi:hypothetical protein